MGATGTVGQKFILLLSSHPQLELHVLGASERSAGKLYPNAVKWKQAVPIPAVALDLKVNPCKAEYFKDCDVVFSGLDADVAGDIEKEFSEYGLAVFSNAKSYRRDPLVPLVVPTVNPSHLDLVAYQKKERALVKNGFLVTNANCSTTGLVVPLAALLKLGPIDWVSVVTMQAISGAGYPGVASLDILDNVVPYISGEEEKMEWETLKILGDVHATGFKHLEGTKISATCNRVPVLDGHLLCVTLKWATRDNIPSIDQAIKAMQDYTCEAQALQCHSAPKQAIHVFDSTLLPDRPQPRLDRDLENGYGASVGRVRKDESGVGDLKFVCLSHNTILGAAGSSVLNAEIAVKKNLI